ncbi:MAG: HEPN family nuclease [Sedimentisphaerales bacterium]|nr:HEPN family nuclease [Sedimentisphaerales bacterium]
MSYLDEFEHSFMQHTQEILREYKGQYDATILINCLLGLLIVSKECFPNAIPDEPLSELKKWGIAPNSIENPGKPTKVNPRPETLRGLVHNLRNAIAHFNLTPIPKKGPVHSFQFTDESGLKADIKLDEMRLFIERLAKHLDNQ